MQRRPRASNSQPPRLPETRPSNPSALYFPCSSIRDDGNNPFNLYLVNRDLEVMRHPVQFQTKVLKIKRLYRAPARFIWAAAAARLRDSRISAVASRAASRALRMPHTASSKQSSHLR